MTIGTAVLPGGNNTYVQSHDASGNLVTGFSRNPTDFALNQYIQLRDVTKMSGFYLVLSALEAGRILNSDLADFVWPDGADRPQNNDGTEEFAFADFRCTRYNFPYKLGREAVEQADFAVAEAHQRLKAQQAMTARTEKVHQILASASSWEAAHIKDVTTITGNTGAWDVSTSARQDIKRSLDTAAEQIMLSTLSVVKKADLKLVLSPPSAHRIAECQEIVDHIKGSPDAYGQVKGATGRWSQYGLPDKLYGYEVVVEDAVKVTSRRGATTPVRSFVMDDGIAYLLARPGGLIAPAGGGPSFSTATLFVYEDMSVEEFDKEYHRRIEGHVVDNYAPAVTASASGFKFTGILT